MFAVRKRRTHAYNTLIMRKVYKLKHKPTGLFWIKSGYGHLSDKGSLFTTGTHSLSGRKPDEVVELHINDQKLIKKYIDILKNVGTLKKDNWLDWNVKEKRYESKEHWFWSMNSKVSDFEKEIIAEIQ